MDTDTQEIYLTAPTKVAESYVEAIRAKDPGKAMFAPDVSLQFPLSPRKIEGRENVIEYLLSIMPGIDDVRIERHMSSGEYVATLWEAQTPRGSLPICSVFRITDGLIREVRSFWDPRPLFAQV